MTIEHLKNMKEKQAKYEADYKSCIMSRREKRSMREKSVAMKKLQKELKTATVKQDDSGLYTATYPNGQAFKFRLNF